MSDLPTPYQVEYSGRVRQELRSLARKAIERGDGDVFLAAMKEFHRRLCVYPQFGDPLIDLTHEPGQICIGIVRPLSMRYGLYEDRRLVLVVDSPVLMPMSLA